MSNQTVQFPLCGLAYGDGNAKDRVLSCMAHGVVSAGKMQLKRLTQDQADAVIAQAPKCDAPRSFDRGNLRILLLGRAFTGVYFSHATWPWDAAGQVECFRLEWKAKHHTAPWTRVLSDIAIKTGWHNADYNFFAALCAFNAAIGSKPYAVVTRSRIRAGMLGYSSGRLLFDKDGNLVSFLTTKGVRDKGELIVIGNTLKYYTEKNTNSLDSLYNKAHNPTYNSGKSLNINLNPDGSFNNGNNSAIPNNNVSNKWFDNIPILRRFL